MFLGVTLYFNANFMVNDGTPDIYFDKSYHCDSSLGKKLNSQKCISLLYNTISCDLGRGIFAI